MLDGAPLEQALQVRRKSCWWVEPEHCYQLGCCHSYPQMCQSGSGQQGRSLPTGEKVQVNNRRYDRVYDVAYKIYSGSRTWLWLFCLLKWQQ